MPIGTTPTPSAPVRRRTLATRPLAAVLAPLALTLAGCGVGDTGAPENIASATSSSPTVAATATDTEVPASVPSTDRIPPVGPTFLRTADTDDLGTIIVDGSDRTLYVFSGDTAENATCYDACADTWMPLLSTGNPAGGIGIDTTATGTVTRRDGSVQVAYHGHPLYRYAGDTAPGQIDGQGLRVFGGVWSVLTPDGEPVA
ncbi:COG4315 family predicted lipoprotein [Mycolicibacterium palauense]|uniref:COG4315 family predicted lipoprotein n=1 Tax=Mycolicibacterium palauense TaxID=2034511 RepID=UPI000BFEF962|nr:hypothetical protein [Mycolicibacterium palauense]